MSSSYARPLQIAGYYSFILLGWNAVVVPSLIRSIEGSFHQPDAGIGVLYFLKSLLYLCGAFGGGFLTERFGRRAVLLLGTMAPVIGLIGAAGAPYWVLFVAGNALCSWGTGTIDGGMNALFLDLYRDARGAALNFLHLFFSVGALVAPFLIGHLVGAGLPWRTIVLSTGIGFLLMVPTLVQSSMPSGRHEQHADGAEGEVLDARERSLLPFLALAGGIALYTGAEIGVSSWLVRLLASSPLVVATAILSLFWFGLTGGRLLSGWVAERIDYTLFTAGCFLLASASLVGAVVVPWLPAAACLFAMAGLFYGPVYPTIMALGGNIYPHRLSALSGSLTAAASVGVLVYPPLMGLLAAHVGLRNGMIGAALIGVPGALAVVAARRFSRLSFAG